MGVYAHILVREERLELLSRLRSTLEPGSPILLSFGTRTGAERGLAVTHAIAALIRRIRPGVPPPALGDTLGDGVSHLFTRDELLAELEAAGLEVLEFSEEGFGHAIARVAR